MRKSVILEGIEKELRKSSLIESNLAEISLTALDSSRNKNRLAYCVLKNHTAEELDNIIRKSLVDKFNVNINSFKNIVDAQKKHLKAMNDPVILENNWRGRLFSFDQIESRKENDNDIKEFMLNSVWRIIVQKDGEKNYYVRHDIFPYFWSPGHSTGGKTEYEERVKNEFWNIAEPKFPRQDYDFDFIKAFGKKGGEISTFRPIPFCDLNTNPKEPKDFQVTFNMNHSEKEIKLNNLISQLNSFF